MNPVFRPVCSAMALTIIAALTACTSLSGLDGSAKYGCKAPEGVQCQSVSGTYYNALQHNLPSQRQRRPPAGKPPAASTSMPPLSAVDDAHSLLPLRSRTRVLRLWIKPWEDSDHDLHDQSFVYLQIDHGRWLIEHAQQRIRDAYAPIRAPHATARPATDTSPPARSLGTAGAIQ